MARGSSLPTTYFIEHAARRLPPVALDDMAAHVVLVQLDAQTGSVDLVPSDVERVVDIGVVGIQFRSSSIDDVVRLKRRRQAYRLRNVEAAVAVDQDLDIGAGRFANRRNALDTKMLRFDTELAAQIAI